MHSSLPWFKVGKILFTPASTGKYITDSALNKPNQEHSAPQKSFLRLGSYYLPQAHFSSTHPCKIPPCFYLCSTAFLRIECTPGNWFPDCKISNTAKYILLVLTEMAEETFLCSSLKADALFLHIENLYRTGMKGCLKVWSAKLSFCSPGKDLNAKNHCIIISLFH